MPFFLLSLAIIAEVVGTTALKFSDGMTRVVPSIVVVVAYMVAFYLLSLVLRYIPVGVAYAIWAGGGIVLITLVGWLYLRQGLDGAGMLGIGLIVAGVLVLQLFSKSASLH
ncbi:MULTISPECIES: SMR family transporter [Ectothiorhodospira]|jgi:small multidrug resistance pump|uniref:Small multidrug resistance pump n=1 Tax=Ectothiorhodospira marina TaxID=1396821 RepID=A0A1H7MH04_9GAMM|nr:MULTISPECIES: SMR family transporter [Ectothiorhodospira]MCG5514626.1 SMR family transporter [Ectothiorhodospira sp. 9100]MCG5518000.1 SMR family transporter [Ectothiorhodospira sp. 9905]SEL09897.1 small multidrug resistance pump [Ectothiorhodospira marina]